MACLQPLVPFHLLSCLYWLSLAPLHDCLGCVFLIRLALGAYVLDNLPVFKELGEKKNVSRFTLPGCLLYPIELQLCPPTPPPFSQSSLPLPDFVNAPLARSMESLEDISISLNLTLLNRNADGCRFLKRLSLRLIILCVCLSSTQTYPPQKKLPQTSLSQAMVEGGNQLGEDSLIG